MSSREEHETPLDQTSARGNGRNEENSFACPSALLKKYAKGPFQPEKPLLQFVTKVWKGEKKSGYTKRWLCHICKTECAGSYTKVESHLLKTPRMGVRVCGGMNQIEMAETNRLAQEAKIRMFGHPTVESSSSTFHGAPKREGSSFTIPPLPARKKFQTISAMMNVQGKEEANVATGQLLFADGLPIKIAQSPYFKEAIEKACEAGPSYVLPSEHELRTTLLDKQYSKYILNREKMKEIWLKSGCSIIMSGWTDIHQSPLINIIITCSAGPCFLRAIDCLGKEKDVEFQFLILKEAIDEIGASNVVQVVTDATLVCQRVGRMIEQFYRHIYWTPCCVHALNNILKDIGKISWIKKMVVEARDMQMYICNHPTSLALFKIYSKKEFTKPKDTRYVAYFILLERMLEIEDALQSMVVSPQWKKWAESKTQEAKKVRVRLLDEDWWSQARYIVSFISPIVAVIRYANTQTPNLGEIYETFNIMLGQMKKIIQERDPNMYFYEEHIRPIFQRRWDKMNTPLHMAAYALNPKWYAPNIGRMLLHDDDDEVTEGFMAAIQKMYSREEAQTLRDEWLKLVNLKGPFFSLSECREDRATIAQKNPVGWWQLYGSDTLNLCHLAVRLLSQVGCCSSAERNWSTYSFILNVVRNKPTSCSTKKLVAVHSFLRLQDRVKIEYKQSPTAQWDVDPEDARQIDDDEELLGLAGMALDDQNLHLDEEAQQDGSSDDDGGTLPHESMEPQ